MRLAKVTYRPRDHDTYIGAACIVFFCAALVSIGIGIGLGISLL